MTALEEFKNKLLLEKIHEEERSDSFSNKCRWAKETIWSNGASGDVPPFMVFSQLALAVVRHQQLILLCKELKQKDLKQSCLVNLEDDYYLTFFNDRIKKGEALLRKLRPLVLEDTKEFTTELKLKYLNDASFGKFFKGWFYPEVLSTQMLKVTVNGKEGFTSSPIPQSSGRFPVWFPESNNFSFVHSSQVEFATANNP